MTPTKSPFKFLDAYTRKDRKSFFGRDLEIDSLYQLVFETKLILVYGASGTGKTSIIQCGLANRFQDSDWFDIYIRHRGNINNALKRELKRHAKTPLEDSMDITEMVDSLYLDFFKPVYLIFDQFEELYVLGTKAERIQFIEDIATLYEADINCKIIFIIREEYLAKLNDFEKKIPHLFDKRLRIEPMSNTNIQKVIAGTANQFNITLTNSEETIDSIIDNISDDNSRVQLSYLQVYLDRLYQEAVAARGSGDHSGQAIQFTKALVEKVGSIDDVLADFFDKQVGQVDRELHQQFPKTPDNALNQFINTFATLEGTKRPLKKEELSSLNIGNAQINFCLNRLEKARILRIEDDTYELAHDTLALHISQKRSADEVALLEISKLVKDRHYNYKSTNTLLNPKEIQWLENYKIKLEEAGKLNKAEWDFVKKSEKEIGKKRRRLILLTSSIIGILLLSSIYANYARHSAENAKIVAEEALAKLKSEERKSADESYGRYMAQGKNHYDKAAYQAAISEYEKAFEIADKFPDDDWTGEEAQAAIAKSEEHIECSSDFNNYINTGDSLYEQGKDHYIDALEYYREALDIDFNNNLAQNKIDKVDSKLAGAFEQFKKHGDIFYEAAAYDFAYEQFKQAARINGRDAHVREKLKACRDKL